MTRALLPALLLLGACSSSLKGEDADDSSGEGPGSDGGDGGGGDGGGSGEGGEDALDALPDLLAGADLSGCQQVEGSDGEMYDVPGAVSYFYGEYYQTEDGSGWAGKESWLLYANDRWQELGEDDCQIVWTMGADLSGDLEPGGQVSLQVRADIRGSETTCPEGLYEGEESWTASYSIEINDNGDSFWYYNGADQFATGGSSGVALNFLTDKACTWF